MQVRGEGQVVNVRSTARQEDFELYRHLLAFHFRRVVATLTNAFAYEPEFPLRGLVLCSRIATECTGKDDKSRGCQAMNAIFNVGHPLLRGSVCVLGDDVGVHFFVTFGKGMSPVRY